LKTGQHERGMELFGAALPAAEALTESVRAELKAGENVDHFTGQLVNARSNGALLKIALGGSLDEAVATWGQGAPSGHAESLFYPAIVLERQGKPAQADRLAQGMDTATRLDIESTLREGLLVDQWFADWCRTGLEILARNPATLQQFNVDSLNVTQLKSLPLVVDERIKPALWDAVNAAIAGDPTAEAKLRAFANRKDATAWVARAELGAFLVAHEGQPARVSEGIDILLRCLEAPFSDIVAMAAWNLSEHLFHAGMAGTPERLAQVACDLGDGTALRVTAERSLEDGNVTQALDKFRQAISTLSRGDANRTLCAISLARQTAQSLPDLYCDWFLDSQESITDESWNKAFAAYVWAGDFNVDVARTSIATGYFEECPARCYFEELPVDCMECGRTTETSLGAPSGRGDGGYTVLRLLVAEDVTDGSREALFVPFMESDRADLPYAQTAALLAETVASSAPVLLGTLRVADALVVSDSAKCLDNRDVAVRMEVPQGDYAVIAWLRPDLDTTSSYGTKAGDPLDCVALSAVPVDILHLLAVDELDSLENPLIESMLRQLWGDPDRSVHALMANIRPQVLTNMYDQTSQFEFEDADSYLLQLAEDTEHGRDAVAALQVSGRVASFETLELLRIRGYNEPTLPWWQPTMARNLADLWARVIIARDPAPFASRNLSNETVWVRRAVAKRTDITEADFTVLRQDLDTRVRRNLAENSALPGTWLATLVNDSTGTVLSALASNPSTPVQTLTLLAESGSGRPTPRGALAENPKTPEHALGNVTAGATETVREAVAGRADLPDTLAHQLLEDSTRVRRALAANPQVPASVLRSLAVDTDDSIRANVAANPSAPFEILAQLASDDIAWVRDSIMENPSATDEAKTQVALLGAPPPTRATAPPAVPKSLVCAQCGEAIQASHRFCAFCGSAQHSAVPAATRQRNWEQLQATWEIRGNFNVEGGAAAISTQIFDWCDCQGELEDQEYCENCGRGPGNYIASISGAGDGVYPVFRLMDDLGNITGAIAMFEQTWAQGTEDGSKNPAGIAVEATATYAGTLSVDTQLLFSEATAGWGTSYALVDVQLPSGDYDVVAWIADIPMLAQAHMEPVARPIALAAYRRELFHHLIEMDSSAEARDFLKSSSHMLTQVMAHQTPRWADACQYNAAEAAQRGEDDLATSWLLHAAVHGDADARRQVQDLLESTSPLEVSRRQRLLEWRGQRATTQPE
jgi:hypothetical protein